MSELFDRHSPALLRFFMRRTFDHQASVDLVGETYAVALESRKKFRGESLDEARGWLYGIATNLLNDFFRSGQIERRAMERLRMEAAVPEHDDIARIDELAGIAELRGVVARAISALPAEQRRAVELRVVEHHSYEEVAHALGISEQTARARVSRALKRLRATIDAAERAEEANGEQEAAHGT